MSPRPTTNWGSKKFALEGSAARASSRKRRSVCAVIVLFAESAAPSCFTPQSPRATTCRAAEGAGEEAVDPPPLPEYELELSGDED